MLKIALTGAHGTGKTTLTTALHEEIANSFPTSVCREVPRVIIETVGQESFFRRGNNTPLRQCIILLFQIMEDYFQSQNSEIVISDRTMVDHLAYTLCLFPDFEHEPDLIPIQEAIGRWMSTYDSIFKIPIEFPVLDDGVREGDIGFQNAIDAKIDELYARLGIDPITISGTVEQRKASVMSALPLLVRHNKQT